MNFTNETIENDANKSDNSIIIQKSVNGSFNDNARKIPSNEVLKH